MTYTAVKNGWIAADPFAGYKYKVVHRDRRFLTETELQAVMKVYVPNYKTAIVRDIFVFCCFTFVALIKPILIINELQTYNRGIGNDLETICLHHFA